MENVLDAAITAVDVDLGRELVLISQGVSLSTLLLAKESVILDDNSDTAEQIKANILLGSEVAGHPRVLQNLAD